MKNGHIANSWNFFNIKRRRVYFWGMNVQPISIPMTSIIEKMIKQLSFPKNEVIEINDDDTLLFFNKFYPLNFT